MATKTFSASKAAVMGKQTSGGSFSGWNGLDSHMQVGATGSYKWRSVAYFPIDFTGMLSINSATLYLYRATTGSHQNQSQTASLKVARMTKTWSEGTTDPGDGNLTGTLSWEWDNMYDQYTNTGSNTKNITDGGDETECFIDITDIATSWFNGSSNHGVILINNDSETNTAYAMLFYSDEKSGFKPKVVIDYETNTAPSPPYLTSPVDSTTQNTLTPTMAGTRNDPDSGDYITAVQIQVNGPLSIMRWNYSTTVASGDPGAGTFRMNNAATFSATNMYISETDYDGVSRATEMGTWAGKYIQIYNGEYFARFLLGSPTDNGTWRTFPLTLQYAYTFPAVAAVCQFEIDTNSTMSSVTGSAWDSGYYTIAGSPTTFSVTYGAAGTPAALVGNSWYKWRARTYDKEGLPSTSYAEWELFKVNSTPNAPSTTLPTPVDDIPDQTPDFSVSHSDPDVGDDKMYGYQVVVEKETSVGSGSWTTTGGWDSGQVDTSGSPATTKAITSGSLAWGGSYRVKARTKDSNNTWSSYSGWSTFKVHAAGVPVNLDPAGNEAVGVTPTLYGERATTADTITSFEIIVYSDDLVSTLWTSGVQTTTITSGSSFSKVYAGSTLTAGSFYQWKARVTSSVGGTSDWSALQRFQVNDTTVPTFTAPTSPATTLTPTIGFGRATTFNRYQYELYPSTATSGNLGSYLFQSTVVNPGSVTSVSVAYGGAPALAWNTQYKLRVKVSADAGATWSNWSGLFSFTTDAASTPVLTSIAGDASATAWITDSTPDFLITRQNSEGIYQAQFRLWNSTHTVMLWDSGMQGSYAGATTATFTYNGPALTQGTTYTWDAAYRKTILTGATGPFATYKTFRLNAPPSAPSGLVPINGEVYSDFSIQVGADYLPTFRATFSDPDTAGFADTPNTWEIVTEVYSGTWNAHTTKTLTTSLVVGQNSYTWAAADTDFLVNTDYRWKTRFKDSKLEWGPYSATQQFRIASAPNGTISQPSDDSTLSTVNPTVNWSYSGGTQESFIIDIDRVQSDGTFIENTYSTGERTSAAVSFLIPAGYMKQDKYYRIKLTVKSTDDLYDPTPSEVQVLVLLDPPNPITGLSADLYPDRSLIQLTWDKPSIKASHTFKRYNIYRRLAGSGASEWGLIDTVDSYSQNRYDDWRAGHGINYQYRVTNITSKATVETELESPDDPDGGSFDQTILETDVWMVVGPDRSDEQIAELPVNAESHNRPVQQEAFETLGSNRKVIITGFVLGHEGSITMLWTNKTITHPLDIQETISNTVWGRRIVEYMTQVKTGPWTLKSPFGDVWDVVFGAPDYQWKSGGHLEVSIDWIETGQTSGVIL